VEICIGHPAETAVRRGIGGATVVRDGAWSRPRPAAARELRSLVERLRYRPRAIGSVDAGQREGVIYQAPQQDGTWVQKAASGSSGAGLRRRRSRKDHR